MVVFYWLVMGYVIAPVLLGLLCRTLIRHHLVPDLINRVPARVRALDAKVLLAGGIVFFLGVMGIMVGHKASGGDAPFWLLIIAPLAMYVCTARLFYLRFQKLIVKYSATRIAKLLFALLVFIAVWLSNVYTDSVFLNYTRIAPSDLPAAKTGVLAIVTVFVWVTLISLLTLIPYFLMAVTMWAMTPKKVSAEAVLCLSPSTHQAPQSPPLSVTLILFAGLAFSSVSPLNLVDYTSRNPAFEPFVRKLIAFASFHLKESQCAGDQPAGSVFAPLGYERLAIAILDEEKGYLFKTLKCPNGDAAKVPERKPKVTVPLEFDQQAL
ncbi:hypothetical protein [Pseudomonas tohonis]|uniref:hypothetical protein n=1 Tax=Pseudomonas tohonis TaxID=2725477 RepID=UPI001F2F245F|nr:hypothetical protein [Pseudomonas tohonis]